MATMVTRYVNPDSVGGTGETADLTGAYAEDDFNRANESPLAGNWTTVCGAGLAINGNAVRAAGFTGISAALWNATTYSAEQYSSVLHTVVNIYDYFGVGVRLSASGGGRGYIAIWRNGASTTLYLRKLTGGVESALAQTNFTLLAGDRSRLIAKTVGSDCVLTVQVRRNGVWTTLLSYTDTSSPYLDGQPGLCCDSQNNNSSYIDDFVGGECGGAAYASLAAWNTARARDLVAADEIEEVICATNGTADGAVTFGSGWITDATRYIVIRAADGHRAGHRWSDLKYRINGAGSTYAMFCQAGHTRISGLQVSQPDDLDARAGLVCESSAGGFRIDGCYSRGASGTVQAGDGIRVGGGATTESYIWNCIAEGWISANSRGFSQSGASTTAYNCTAVNCSRGFTNPDNGYNLKVYNCLAANCTNGFDAGWTWGASNYNASDLSGDAPGANSRNSQTFSFVASDDFALTGSDTGAKDYGLTDPGSGLFSTDIAGNTRSAPWDIGAFEYIASGPSKSLGLLLRGCG